MWSSSYSLKLSWSNDFDTKTPPHRCDPLFLFSLGSGIRISHIFEFPDCIKIPDLTFSPSFLQLTPTPRTTLDVDSNIKTLLQHAGHLEPSPLGLWPRSPSSHSFTQWNRRNHFPYPYHHGHHDICKSQCHPFSRRRHSPLRSNPHDQANTFRHIRPESRKTQPRLRHHPQRHPPQSS